MMLVAQKHDGWLPALHFHIPACMLLPAGAIALGYANIFVTAPSPENLRTLFEFVFKGLDACGYQVGGC
jgi:hypothetical protein